MRRGSGRWPVGVAVGIESVVDNLIEGEHEEAALDAVGLVVDPVDVARVIYDIGSAAKDIKDVNDALDEYDAVHRTNKRGSPGF